LGDKNRPFVEKQPLFGDFLWRCPMISTTFAAGLFINMYRMKKIAFGVVVVMLGVFLLFRNMNYISWEIAHWVLSWQSLLIAIGAILLFDEKTDTKNAGVILMLIGGIFLLSKTLGIHLAGILIPLFIIIAGITLVFRSSGKRKWKNTFADRWGDREEFQDYSSRNGNGRGCVKREYVFSGSKEKWSYGKLKEVGIDAVFSNVELDFSQTGVSEDVKVAAHIHVSSVFSSVILYVPDDWNIILQQTNVFGGFVDKRPQNIEVDKEKMVILELDAVFGGGEIRCYE
jgi:predicted membrane protein